MAQTETLDTSLPRYATCAAHPYPVLAVLDLVASELDVLRAQIVLPGKKARFVRARHIAWWLLRQQSRSYPQIAKLTGGWDHSSVMNGVRQMGKARAKDNALDDLLKRLLTTIGGWQ